MAQLWFNLAELLEGASADDLARNAYRSAAAASGPSITPTARTCPAGAMARAENQNTEAAVPKNPAPSDGFQDAATALSAPGRVAASTPPSTRLCSAWATHSDAVAE